MLLLMGIDMQCFQSYKLRGMLIQEPPRALPSFGQTIDVLVVNFCNATKMESQLC